MTECAWGSELRLLRGSRKDELARVKASGARVLTLEQLDGLRVCPSGFRWPFIAAFSAGSPTLENALGGPAGQGYTTSWDAAALQDPNIQEWGVEEEDDGDPPRLWSPAGNYPGTAFTRSIGDSGVRVCRVADRDVAFCLDSRTPAQPYPQHWRLRPVDALMHAKCSNVLLLSVVASMHTECSKVLLLC